MSVPTTEPEDTPETVAVAVPGAEGVLLAQRRPSRSFRWIFAIGIVVALCIAALWLVMALLNPTITYHFSPLLLAAAPSVVVRLQSERAISWRRSLVTVGIGVVLAGVVTMILVLADALRGPVITADFTAVPGSALIETVIALAIGAVIGGVFAIIGYRTRRSVS